MNSEDSASSMPGLIKCVPNDVDEYSDSDSDYTDSDIEDDTEDSENEIDNDWILFMQESQKLEENYDDSKDSNDTGVDQRERKRKQLIRMHQVQDEVKALNGTKYTVPGYTVDSKKTANIKWTVIHEHIPQRRRRIRQKHCLGIKDKRKLQEIKKSTFPLAELHLYLLWKNSDWKTPLNKLNAKIEQYNRKHQVSNPNFRVISYFTPKEFITCHGLFIGASAVLERGTNLWPADDTIDDKDDPWNTIIATTDFSKYLPHYRFKQWKKFVTAIWENELAAATDPWWRFQPAVDEFNEICKTKLLTSDSRVLDEAMCVYKPRTTKLGGLVNILYVARKPEPLGTEYKCIVCPVLNIMCFLEIQRGKDGMKQLPYHSSLGATSACALRLANTSNQSDEDGVGEIVRGDSWFGSVRTASTIQLKQHTSN